MSTLLPSYAQVDGAQAAPCMGHLFDRAFAKYFAYVREVLFKHRVAARDLDDEANETFIAFAQALDRYGAQYDERRGAGLLHTLSVQRARNYRTSARRRREVLASEPFGDGPDPASRTPSPETLVWMKQALARLDPSMEPILRLLLEGFSIREISKVLGIPLGTAFSRMRRVHLDAKRALNRKAA